MSSDHEASRPREPTTPSRQRLQAMFKVPSKLLWKGLQIEVNNAQLKDILSQATAELAKLPSDYKDAKVVPRVA